jgi:hypothetical protein
MDHACVVVSKVELWIDALGIMTRSAGEMGELGEVNLGALNIFPFHRLKFSLTKRFEGLNFSLG